MRICLPFFLVLVLSSCVEQSSDGLELPQGFSKSVKIDFVRNSIVSWARVTAKNDGVQSLRSRFPGSTFKRNAAWLLEPKQIFYAPAENEDVLDRWFFVFRSPDNYYIKMVVDADKQISDFDVDQESTPE